MLLKTEEEAPYCEIKKSKNKMRFFIILFLLSFAMNTYQATQNFDLKDVNNNLHTKIDAQIKEADENLEKDSNISSRYNSFGNFLQISRDDLLNDISESYKHLSAAQQKLIVDTVVSESGKYGNNPLIIYGMLGGESDMRFWLEHALTKVGRAAGLGGVMWKWHGAELKELGIASSRAELFEIVPNIKATVYIYNKYLKMPKLAGAKTYEESAMLRYFGGNYPNYIKRIEEKMLIVVRKKLYNYKES